MTDRDMIIRKLQEDLERLPYIYAFWLEGADATGLADQYSDLDFWADVADEHEEQAYEAVEKALSGLAEIDYKFVAKQDHPKIRQRVYHLAGTSEYLLIDFCWQLHSRPKSECTFIAGNTVENAKVLFDKANIVSFLEYNLGNYRDWNSARLAESKYRYTQLSRVKKYLLRGQYLESFAYYNRYVLEPLINLLRLIYTPANADMYLLHISHHIPNTEREKLEYFAQIACIEDMAKRIPEAQEWFSALLKKLEGE